MYNNYLFIIHTKNNNIKYHKIFLFEIEKPLPLLFLIITSNLILDQCNGVEKQVVIKKEYRKRVGFELIRVL